jgi:hypothetical protein
MNISKPICLLAASFIILSLGGCRKGEPGERGPAYTHAARISAEQVNLWYELSLKITKETCTKRYGRA